MIEEENYVTEISLYNVRLNQNIIGLYKDAYDAEADIIKANIKEIMYQCFSAEDLKACIKKIMINNKVGEKKAKGKYIILLSKNFQNFM